MSMEQLKALKVAGKGLVTPGLEVAASDRPTSSSRSPTRIQDRSISRAGHRGHAVRAPREPGGALGDRARRRGDRARHRARARGRPPAALGAAPAGDGWPTAPSGSPAASWRSRPSTPAPARSPRSATRSAAWPPRSNGALGTATAAERERRFLLTAIAHDLRTPLFTLRGSLEAIERGIGDEHSLTRAQDKAAHLDRLVGDLFAFSRAEYAREEHAGEPVDLTAIARRAAETVEPGAMRLDVVTNGPVRARRRPGRAAAGADEPARQRAPPCRQPRRAAGQRPARGGLRRRPGLRRRGPAARVRAALPRRQGPRRRRRRARAGDRAPAGARPRRRGGGGEPPGRRRPRDGDAQFQASDARRAQ